MRAAHALGDGCAGVEPRQLARAAGNDRARGGADGVSSNRPDILLEGLGRKPLPVLDVLAESDRSTSRNECRDFCGNVEESPEETLAQLSSQPSGEGESVEE